MKYLQSKLIVASVFLVNSLLLQTVAGFLMQPQAAANIKLTWETIFAEKIRQARNEMNEDRPYMVCITGIPGSGKSTSGVVLEQQLSDVGSLLMPFDGYHIPKATLETLPNALDAIWRRGAPDTFDAQALIRDLDRIRNGNEPVVKIPGFDHAMGDPENDKHEFRRNEHKIVLCEGLYLLHDENGWETVKDFFDISVFVEADIDRCMERVKIRNRCIPGYTPEEIDHRVDVVDRVNALIVDKSKSRADFTVLL